MTITSFGSSASYYGIAKDGFSANKNSQTSQNSETDKSTLDSESSTEQNSTDEEQESTTSSDIKNESELSIGEKMQVSKLQVVDAAVRAHEAAHLAAGGGVAKGGASFGYEKGPDGKMYAVSGEVPIDMSEGNSPDETISKMQQVRAAAMAPADPSPQDYKVASTATILEMKARVEQQKEIGDSMRANAEKQIGEYAANEKELAVS